MTLNPLLLFRTLEHLRWEQLAYRPLRVAQFRLYRNFPGLASRQIEAKADAVVISPQTVEIIRQVFADTFAHFHTVSNNYEQRLSDLENRRFTFLNCSLTLDRLDWNQRYGNHLWNYQLHYFDFAIWCANALTAWRDVRGWRVSQALIESWMDTARVGKSDGWDAYPLSLRVVNWMYAYALV